MNYQLYPGVLLLYKTGISRILFAHSQTIKYTDCCIRISFIIFVLTKYDKP